MSIKSFVADVVIQVIEDERTQAVAEKLVATTITKYVAPLIPPMIAAAIDQAFDHLTDLDNNGKPDVAQVVDAAQAVIGPFLPPWLKIPGINA
jgi:hypothetical protein